MVPFEAGHESTGALVAPEPVEENAELGFDRDNEASVEDVKLAPGAEDVLTPLPNRDDDGILAELPSWELEASGRDEGCPLRLEDGRSTGVDNVSLLDALSDEDPIEVGLPWSAGSEDELLLDPLFTFSAEYAGSADGCDPLMEL